ncbi:MAG TPA: tryptophan 7-halogenase, partial [Gammaproteobacteria bacterium]|nr:tryptophan 7-halogenase [Gammaproteobacteria bacterium]
MSEHEQYDVVIVGAGPAGCTVGCYLKKYQPNLKIIILDRASEISLHGGETLTPNLNAILKELDLWEAINQSDWIIKLGTTYRWGKTNSLWDLDSLPKELCESLQKNKDQESLRNHVSFFIDRTEFDKLLQERCKALGCIIQKDTPVAQINHDNQSITALELKTGETIQAKYYVDASGNVALFRRFLQLPTFSPFDFSHTFIWDHWHFSKDFLKG